MAGEEQSTPGRVLHGPVSGPEVQAVQETLRLLGFDPGQTDGVYGPDTAAAVRLYQGSRRMAEDGVVGRQTWQALAREKGSAIRGLSLRKPLVGATAGPDVLALQGRLRSIGFDPGELDGVYGPATARAVRAFQVVHGLAPDGLVGAATNDALFGRSLRLSDSVAEVLRSSPPSVVPSDLARRVVALHKEYGKGRPQPKLAAHSGEIRQAKYEWLAQVRALFDTERAPELHGRLVVVGLGLLDGDLRDRLRAGGYLDAVVAEITEPMDRLLTKRGRALWERPSVDSEETRWQRLSPGLRGVLAYADGLRGASGRSSVHMEHLVAALDQKRDGPLARLLARVPDGRGALAAAIAEATEAPLPATATPTDLTALPPLSGHAVQALGHAFRLADMIGAPVVHTRYAVHGALSVEDCTLVEALAARGVHADDVEGWNLLSVPRVPLLAGTAADTVPEPGEGRVRAADRLGTAAEVEALASVLLAQDTPLPLAVGLFGDWGSGKSFFMAQMQERMHELADLAAANRPEAAPFCRVVRQVRFNAWHYVDANLWASLAATLFDELARADAPDVAKVKLDELAEAREKADEARRAREAVEAEERKLAATADRSRAAIHHAAAAAIRAVRDDPQLMSKLRGAARQPQTADAERLITALGSAQGATERAGTAWRLFQEEILHRRRWATLLTLVTFLAGAGALVLLSGWQPISKIVAVATAVVVGLSPALGGVMRVLYLAREAREARELPLVKKREELEQARASEEEAAREVTRRERELALLRDKGRQLRDFVRERATSADYRGQLGVISMVRRDFEQLAKLLPGGLPAEAEQVAAVAAVTQEVTDVERIVLFIDDLDRCPHGKVVEVLQAVHLLLAFKLFVVVVGVDSRWLARSLRAHYQNLLEDPDSYLEKIFQIPYTLRRMTEPGYRDLIDQLTPGAAAPPPQAPEEPAQEAGEDSEEPATDETTPTQDTTVVVSAAPALPRPETLVISEPERALLRELSDIVPTPRAAKRLVNLYRMLRVSVPEDEHDAFAPDGGGEYQAVVVLLGILVGRVAAAEPAFQKILNTADGGDIWEVLDLPELASLSQHVTLRRIEPYRRWVPRVSRFSLRLMSTMPAAD